MREQLYKLLPLCLAMLLICATAAHAASKKNIKPEEFLTPAQIERFNKANELFEQEDYKGIVILLRDMVEKSDRPHPYGCVMYGVAHMRLNDNKKAMQVFRKGIAASPDYSALHLNLGVALIQEEQFEKAGECFWQAHTIEEQASPKPLYAYTAAQCYYFAQKYSRSLEAVKTVLVHPEAKPDWVNLAAVNCMQMNKWTDAEGYLLRLVEMEPGKRQNWKSLAYSRLRMERHNSAAAALDIAARLPETSERDHKELSGMYRHAKAPILSLEVEKLLPPGQEQEKIYISSLLRANRQVKLIEYVDKLISKKPAPELYMIKGTAHYRLGELKSAQRAFHAGAAVQGKESERCHLLEGMVAWEARDWQSAKAAFSMLTGEECKFKYQASQAIGAIEAMEDIEAKIAEMDEHLEAGQQAGDPTPADNAVQKQPQDFAKI